MDSFFAFFTVLLASLFLSTFFEKFHFPWVITLILAGIVVGPYGFELVEVNETLQFIGQTGLVLLMFMAGLQSRLSSFKGFETKLIFLAFLNGFIPFLAGFFIARYFGIDSIASVLIGIIFVSSSIAVVVPTLESSGLINKPLGKYVLMTSILQDVASLVLLSLFLQSEIRITILPLPIFYAIIFILLVLLRYMLPKIQKFILAKAYQEKDLFHRDIRAVLVVLFGIVILFEILGLHPIIGGFFAGMVLSESLESEVLLGKIRAISYGIFIPVFFIMVGITTNISFLIESADFLFFTLAIIGGSVLSKFLSGTLGARSLGFSNVQSSFFGATSIPQLSTTLAATYAALEFGVFTDDIATSMVALCVVTTAFGPFLITILNKYILTDEDLKKT